MKFNEMIAVKPQTEQERCRTELSCGTGRMHIRDGLRQRFAAAFRRESNKKEG